MYITNKRNTLFLLIKILFLVFFIHTVLIIFFEKTSLQDALWLTATSITTVGYGDISPKTLYGRLTTTFCIYIIGITILTQILTVYLDYYTTKKQLIVEGKWFWSMKNHIIFVILNKQITTSYLSTVIDQIRHTSLSSLRKSPILITGQYLPQDISSLQDEYTKYYLHSPFCDEFAIRTCLDKSRYTIITSTDSDSHVSDSVVGEITFKVRSASKSTIIIAEIHNDKKRKRIHELGASHVIRPIRVYPEIISRTLIAPGSEIVLENLFNNSHQECLRIDIELTASWKDIIYLCTEKEIGIPIAYISSNDNKIYQNPKSSCVISMAGIFIIINVDTIIKDDINAVFNYYKESRKKV